MKSLSASAIAAMVNGKRDVFKNSINFTQLCFSNPQVRKDCIDYLISFVKERKSSFNDNEIIEICYSI